jgi:4-carboxymuconolactone decarboxylase
MADRPISPRIPPLADDELTGEQRELLPGTDGPAGTASHIFSTLVRHTGLFRKWMPFGGKLLAGKLPARDREILILRTGWNTKAEYEWGQHVRIGKQAGLTDEDVERITAGPDAPGWDPFDALLLRAADELHDDACISDATWKELSERYDEKQMVEVPMLVGHYHMVSFTLNSLGVQREKGVVGFPKGA